MKYPYYIVPEVEAYRKLDPDSDEAKSLSRLIAANIGDYAALRLVLGIDPPEFARFYPDMVTETPSTFDTIDSFLDKFGGKLGDELPEPSGIPYIMAEEEEPEPAPGLRELLRQKKYEDALELIERQNLNNPQKSVYFALQIRFVRKLKAIEEYRSKTRVASQPDQ